jgi:N utilization substance protein A
MAQMVNKSELISALEQIEKDKGIPKDDILRMIEQAIVSAYRKHAGQMVNVQAVIDAATGQMQAYVVKTIVETVTTPAVEITVDEAQKLRNAVVTETEVKIPVDAEDFARIAAQTAKQVLIQKIRETERESLYTEYKPKEGQLINGSVLRFSNRNIIIDLGRSAEGILPMREQVRRERWMVGDRIRVLILKVEKGMRGPEVVLSRAHPDFLRRLFEQEVPEIYEKTVEVVDVAREAGLRAKVVVRSNNPKVDPIGACVGVKGSRVRPIINELQGERIDLVAYTMDTTQFIANALSPVKPLAVKVLSLEEKKAEALVADDQLSLAIGKGGQNVRLAAKLTGWSIDVRSEGQKRDAAVATASFFIDQAFLFESIGAGMSETLQKSGWGDVNRLAAARPADLAVVQDMGEEAAGKIIDAAKSYLESRARAAAEQAAAHAAAVEAAAAAPTDDAAVEAVPVEPTTDNPMEEASAEAPADTQPN